MWASRGQCTLEERLNKETLGICYVYVEQAQHAILVSPSPFKHTHTHTHRLLHLLLHCTLRGQAWGPERCSCLQGLQIKHQKQHSLFKNSCENTQTTTRTGAQSGTMVTHKHKQRLLACLLVATLCYLLILLTFSTLSHVHVLVLTASRIVVHTAGFACSRHTV